MPEDEDRQSIYDEDPEEPIIQLGYAEEPEGDLCPASFPSKLGGKPAWLNPETIPEVSQLTCPQCQEPMVFLLQLYAPEDEPEEAFHRTIFIFCCRNGKCHRQSSRLFKVFRAQLPRENAYYPPSSSSDDDDDVDNEDEERGEEKTSGAKPTLQKGHAHMCLVCGIKAEKACGACHVARYCSKAHQRLHWTQGEHKQQCPLVAKVEKDSEENVPALTTPAGEDRMSKILFHLSEIVSEPEPERKEGRDDEDGYNAGEVELLQRMRVSENPAMADAVEDAEDSAAEVDSAFLTFQERISLSPDQILRYGRTEYGMPSGQPLWLSDLGKPVEGKDIPACERCKAPRTFEFQILPQVFNHLGIDHMAADSLDWGTLTIWTCMENCTTDGVYVEEVIWRQDVSEDGIGAKYRQAASKLPPSE